MLEFVDPGGSITGSVLPTGRPIDVLWIRGVPLEVVACGLASSVADVLPAIPKLALVGPPAATGDLCVRSLSMGRVHGACQLTGGVCTALAAGIPGTLVAAAYGAGAESDHLALKLEHPSGSMRMDVHRVTRPDGSVGVQIGESAGPAPSFQPGILRSNLATVLGYANMWAPNEIKRAAYERILEHASSGELTIEVERIALADITAAWQRQASSPHRKLVITP